MVRTGAVLLLAALAVSGCATGSGGVGEPRVVQPGAPGDPTRVRTDVDLAAEVPEYAPEDAEFMRMMIAHHHQALIMTDLVPERAGDPSIELLARRIEVTQEEEIGIMHRWLHARGERLPTDVAGHAHAAGMHGFLSEAELAQLAAARGEEFDELFLRFMIRHHQGAVQMVQELLASDQGGQESEVFQFASGIAADQPIEIGRMQRMLERYAR